MDNRNCVFGCMLPTMKARIAYLDEQRSQDVQALEFSKRQLLKYEKSIFELKDALKEVLAESSWPLAKAIARNALGED